MPPFLRRCRPAIGLSCLFALLAPTAGHADSPAISPDRVIAVVTDDWNHDGRLDRAVLAEGEPLETDLYLYLSTGNDQERRLAVAYRNLVWRGAFWGTQPSLAQIAGGDLQVQAQNEAIGRNRWFEVLTIGYRDGAFLVVGYAFDSYDTLDLDAGRDCSADFEAGTGLLDGVPFTVTQPAVPLADWQPAMVPANCAAG